MTSGEANRHSADDLAALLAAGGLTPEELAEIERRLASGDVELSQAVARWSEIASRLAGAAPAVQPSPNIRDLLLARITGQTLSDEVSQKGASQPPAAAPGAASVKPLPPTAEETGELVVLRADDVAWQNLAEGIESRTLYVDPRTGRATMLVRMAAGVVYPPHFHRSVEECYVLVGDLRVGEFVLGPGDYQRAPAGTWHGLQTTRQGCLCLAIARL